MVRTWNVGPTIRTLVAIASGILLTVSLVRACSMSYTIWSIRNKSADPMFRFVRDGKAGFMDASGKIVIPAILPDNKTIGAEFHEGLLAIGEDSGYRYIDRSGKVAFSTDAWISFDFSEGLAPAAQNELSSKHSYPKWGFLDRTGHFAISPQYYSVAQFSEGLARVSLAGEVGSTGYIDHAGKFAIPARLTYGGDFHEGLAAAIIGGPCRIINGGSCARLEFRPTLAQPNYDCRYAFIDKRGEPISELRFADAQDFSEGLAPVRIGSKWGFVDRFGRMSIPPAFDDASPFAEGLAAVQQGVKYGFLDHAGNFAIAPQFESASSFSDGRAVVSSMGPKGAWISRYVNKAGLPAFPGEFSIATSFTHGLAAVALDKNGHFAWIDTAGKIVMKYSRPRAPRRRRRVVSP